MGDLNREEDSIGPDEEDWAGAWFHGGGLPPEIPVYRLPHVAPRSEYYLPPNQFKAVDFVAFPLCSDHVFLAEVKHKPGAPGGAAISSYMGAIYRFRRAERAQNVRAVFWWDEITKRLGSSRIAFAGKYPRIHRPPGYRLLRIAEFLYSKTTYELVFQPTIDDLQAEYADALSQGRKWKAAWVKIRGYHSFLAAAGIQSVLSFGKCVAKFWKPVG